MDTWLIVLLIVVGVVVVVSGILFATGKGDVVKKFILPAVAVIGAIFGAKKVLGTSTSEIAKENERIKEELKQIKQERDELRKQVSGTTEDHNKRVAELEEKIKESDAEAEKLRGEIEAMRAQGPVEWYKSLSAEDKQKIKNEIDRPGLPEDFLN